jgi:ribosomal-protein-alanine N-acetyltransferase
MSVTLPEFPDGYKLTTSRLTLRPPQAKDFKEMALHMADSRIPTFLAWEPHKSIQETESLIEALIDSQKKGKSFHWIIVHGGNAVGLASIIDVLREHRCWTLNRAELAYWVAPEAQGRGLATEAASKIMEFGFSRLGLNKLRAYHASDNPISGRVIQKLGFRRVGTEREAFFKRESWHDLEHYELLASEHLKKQRD